MGCHRHRYRPGWPANAHAPGRGPAPWAPARCGPAAGPAAARAHSRWPARLGSTTTARHPSHGGCAHHADAAGAPSSANADRAAPAPRACSCAAPHARASAVPGHRAIGLARRPPASAAPGQWPGAGQPPHLAAAHPGPAPRRPKRPGQNAPRASQCWQSPTAPRPRPPVQCAKLLTPANATRSAQVWADLGSGPASAGPTTTVPAPAPCPVRNAAATTTRAGPAAAHSPAPRPAAPRHITTMAEFGHLWALRLAYLQAMLMGPTPLGQAPKPQQQRFESQPR